MGNPKTLPVSDLPAERYIKVIAWIAVITLGIISYFGDRFINRQDSIVDGQNRMIEAIGSINGNVQALRGEVLRNTSDIKELKIFHTNIRDGLKP